jgi:predicted RNase H-like HicB family nuclease
MKLTATIQQDESWYIGTVPELPGVFTQGKSLEEVKDNLIDAIRLYLADGNGPGTDESGVPIRPTEPPSMRTSVELQLPDDNQND